MNNTEQYEELTLKSIILKIKEYRIEIVKKWWIILMAILFASGLLFYQHSKHQVKFIAPLKFLVEGDNGGGGMLGGILGQIGIKRGTSNNPYKIIEFARSNKFVANLLNCKFENENLANTILEKYDLPSKWAENNSALEGFRFSKDSIELESRLQKIVFHKLKSLLLGGSKDRSRAFINLSYNDDSAIYNLVVQTKSEELSLYIANTVFDNIRHFFEDELLEDRLKSIVVLNAKADSLNRLRVLKNYELAQFLDKNANTIYNTSNVKVKVLQQDIQIINIAYGEVVKNREFAEISFSQQKPMFVTIDTPMMPLSPILSIWYIALIKSIIIGGFFGVTIIIMTKTYRDIMAS